MKHVIRAKSIKDYIIELTFNNKVKGNINLENTIFNDHRAIFKELTDKKNSKILK